MRALLLFDMPIETVAQRKSYRKFVRFLKKNGFVMFQKSVYVKICINRAAMDSTINTISANVPKDGSIAMLDITERQFSNAIFFTGEFKSDTLNTDERYIEV